MSKCGTRYQYLKELKAGGPSCDACRAANAEYYKIHKRRRAGVYQTVTYKLQKALVVVEDWVADDKLPTEWEWEVVKLETQLNAIINRWEAHNETIWKDQE